MRHYTERIFPNPKLDERFRHRLKLFIKDPADSVLGDHALTGEGSDYRAFSITLDIRVVYRLVKDGILLYDIGTHIQVY